MNYKNVITSEIIRFIYYKKLPYKEQQLYIQVKETPTHVVHEYQGEFMLCVLPDDTNYAMIEGLNDSAGGAYDGL